MTLLGKMRFQRALGLCGGYFYLGIEGSYFRHRRGGTNFQYFCFDLQ